MLKYHLFCVKFEIQENNQTFIFDEVYELPYLTNEWEEKNKLLPTFLHIDKVFDAICDDLKIKSHNILLIDIYKIHNHLIID